MRIGILGAGTWGIALARMLANNGHSVFVWSALPAEIDTLREKHEHPNLPGVVIPSSIVFTKDIQNVCEGSKVIVFAVASKYMRSTAGLAKAYISSENVIVSVAKGIEPVTHFTMTDILADELQLPSNRIAALSGPTHAEEVVIDLPTTIVSACSDMEIARQIQDIFMNTCLRVYTNTDIIGVELCGALKNIIALAAGISKGLGYGDNASAAIITRGIAEIYRLGEKMGCVQDTFFGLSGIGDMIVTATSIHSRNFTAGKLIGEGLSVEDAIKKVGMVVEGINALPAAMELSDHYKVDMPIIHCVNSIINDGLDPEEAAYKLMNGDKKSELMKSQSQLLFEKKLLDNNLEEKMKRVITYGTFDLLHYGHINLLKRAKALGDYLIVVISSDEFNWNEKHKKCYFTYEQRKALVEAIRYVDLVIPEESWNQKRTDMHEYHIDTFVMGDDWKGKFDFLKEEGVEVVYLPRTPEISSSQIKKDLYDANAVDGESRTSHDDINTDPQN